MAIIEGKTIAAMVFREFRIRVAPGQGAVRPQVRENGQKSGRNTQVVRGRTINPVSIFQLLMSLYSPQSNVTLPVNNGLKVLVVERS